jgi:hypothetical protein
MLVRVKNILAIIFFEEKVATLEPFFYDGGAK